MQENTNMHIPRKTLSEASFYQKIYPIAKHLICRQVFQLVFKEISTFDAQNPLIDLLIRETDIRKEDLASNLVNKSPNLVDFKIELRLQTLKKK